MMATREPNTARVSWLRALALPALGMVMLAAALAWGLVLGEFPAWLLGMGAAGVGVMLLGVFSAQAGAIGPTLSSLAYCFFVTLSVVFVYLISANHSERIDLTAARLHTLSPATVALLQGLEEPVEVTIFAELRDHARFDDWARLYESQSPRVHVEIVDPELDRGRALQFANAVLPGDAWATVIGETEETTRRIRFALKVDSPRLESDLSNAILRAVMGTNDRVYVLSGLGMRPLEMPANTRPGTTDFAIGRFAQALSERALPVFPLSLGQVREIPADAAAVVIAGPNADLFDADREMLLAYLDEGGSLLVLAEPQVREGELANLEALLTHVGLQAPNQAMIDPLGRPTNTAVRGARLGDHPIIAASGSMELSFDFARPLMLAPDLSPHEPDLKVLVESPGGVWGEDARTLFRTRSSSRPDDPARTRSVPLAVAASYATPEGVRGNMARVVAVGDADFLTNALLTEDALVFGLNAVNWLAERNEQLNVPPRVLEPSTLTLTQGRYWTIFGTLMLIGVGLLAGGIGYTVARRRMG